MPNKRLQCLKTTTELAWMKKEGDPREYSQKEVTKKRAKRKAQSKTRKKNRR